MKEREITSTKSQTNPNFQATLKIYDISGRVVKSFNQVVWSGTDNNGNYLPAGVYFVRMASATWIQTVPIILIR